MADPKHVIVAGDWHGNGAWAATVIRQLPDLLQNESPRLILHCGDFGIWPGAAGDRYLRDVNRHLEAVDGMIWFVDGNHEWHPALEQIRQVDGKGWLRDRIWHLPRGHRWTWHGRTWLALGGAVSVDKAIRTDGKSWWAEEEITCEQAAAVSSAGSADVLVTHDCPAGVRHEFPPPPSSWAREDLDRSDVHRRRLQSVVDAVRPGHLIHGHLHRGYTRTVDLGWGHL